MNGREARREIWGILAATIQGNLESGAEYLYRHGTQDYSPEDAERMEAAAMVIMAECWRRAGSGRIKKVTEGGER